MTKLSDIISAFLKGISQSRVSLLGALLTTVLFPILLIGIIADIAGLINNQYMAFAVYMILGPLFLVGLILVFLGLFFFKGKREVQIFTMDYLRDQFSDPVRFDRIRKLIALGVVLTGVNVGIFFLLAYSGYHYMESVEFCGKFCHKVMLPEYTTYQNSPHSSVRCVECHIGAGAQWFVKSKLSGTRQLVAVALDTYPRPIKTPVHNLRPARETCEECHRPELFQGDKLVVKEKTLNDEANTAAQTVLLLKVGSAGDRASSPHGIHWHVSQYQKISYTAADDKRNIIPEVTMVKDDGSKIVFVSEKAKAAAAALKDQNHNGDERFMDCIDCHNRPTHIYLSAEDALDRQFSEGKIPRDLPYAKEEALKAVNKPYKTSEEAQKGIAADLTAYYQSNYPDLVRDKPQLLAKAISGVQEAYAENVFPSMNINWGTYSSLLSHGPDFDKGCFRCHDGEHKAATGEEISSDCNTCHTVLAEGEKNPEILKTLRGE